MEGFFVDEGFSWEAAQAMVPAEYLFHFRRLTDRNKKLQHTLATRAAGGA